MRVLAARFNDRRVASAVRDLLQRRLNLAARDVDIAPLWVPENSAETDTVLAGHLLDQDAELFEAVVERAGGEVVANVDESWTQPRYPSRRRGWDSLFERGRMPA